MIHTQRSAFVTRIASSHRLKAVGKSMLLVTVRVVALLLIFVWISFLVRALGWLDATLKAMLG